MNLNFTRKALFFLPTIGEGIETGRYSLRSPDTGKQIVSPKD
jgi:hypothetical protein